MKHILAVFLILLMAGFAYLFFSPIAIQAVSWQAPLNAGYVDEFSKNTALAQLQLIDISPYSGPEDIVIDSLGNLFTSVHDGKILKVDPSKKQVEIFAEGLGRPLGLAFNPQGELIVADAYLGLLKIDTQGGVEILLNSVGGEPLVYANNIDIADNGIIYFSESSYKYGAKASGGSYPASLLDLMEHCPCGRVFAFDPDNNVLIPLADGLYFANGIALSHDQRSLYINETGMYRVLKMDLQDKRFPYSTHIDYLPGFPDNLSRGLDGKYWLGLVSPRNKLLDAVSDKPWAREMIQRLPKAIRPKATFYSHVVAFDDKANIVENLQDPTGGYPTNTGVLETKNALYISSLTAKVLAVKPKSQ